MKKNLKMFVACGVLLAAVPLMAETETVGGYTWTYRINGDTAEIYGDSSDYEYGYTPCISPRPTGPVSVPSMLGGKPVTSIGIYAFYECSGLTSVTIPDGVTSIGSYAFFDCSGLASVTIGNGVTNIGKYAFSGCIGLTSVVIPESVTSIGGRAFYACTSLEHLTIPDGITRYGADCFEGCPAFYRAVFSGNSSGGSSSGVRQAAMPYSLTNSVADRAIASVTVSADCSIDSFVLKDGKVYDSMMYVSNTADHEVTLTLPAGYTYKTVKGARPLTVPAASQCMISITRVASNVFLVMREELEDVK